MILFEHKLNRYSSEKNNDTKQSLKMSKVTYVVGIIV